MSAIQDRLRELFRNQALWNSLKDKFYRQVDTDSRHELDLHERILDGRGIVSDQDGIDDDELTESLEVVFKRFVIEKIGVPAPIHERDLAFIAVAQLIGLPLEQMARSVEVKTGISRLVAMACAELQAEREGKKRVFFGWWFPGSGEEPDSEIEPIKLWASPTRFTVCAAPKCNDGQSYYASGFLQGKCSRQAMALAEASFLPIVESVAKSVQLCATEEDTIEATGTLAATIHEFDDAWGGAPIPRRDLPLAFLVSGDGSRLVRTCLCAYCRTGSDEDDTLMERLRNATILLSEADRMRSDPLALALSFVAIEALVCEEHELPVEKQVKRHVATLLVQEAGHRSSKGKVIAKLYDIRCKVLHGTKVQASSEASKAVRRIAAAVVRAVICWREHQQRAGGKTSWKELLDEVSAASRKPGIVVGVPDLSELIPNKAPA